MSLDDLTWDVRGEGPPVLFVRNVAQPDAMWPARSRAALVDAGYSTITYLHRGAADTMQALAADAALLVEHLDLGLVHVWGYSQGAMTAQELVLSRPDLCRSGTFMATRGRLSAYDRFRYATVAEMTGDAADLIGLVMQFPADQLVDDSFWTKLTANMANNFGDDGDAMARADRAGMAYGDRLDALTSVTTPCLVVAFSHDLNIPPTLNREVADAIPGCEYVVVDGAGHAGGVTHRRVVLESVLPFLAAH